MVILTSKLRLAYTIPRSIRLFAFRINGFSALLHLLLRHIIENVYILPARLLSQLSREEVKTRGSRIPLKPKQNSANFVFLKETIET